ncbi:ABC transporter permease [Raineya orbicola]|jgi:peptide/nickel transport system permease protein|uniref:Binding-protein-dependent transport system inner membrane component n=1 Tax=Raineya orbicola TaxID=2016530 RepID=A0A2N3IDF1_9BACT|nr:ABC transporter permease [Raineya orbicola]PKQ68253.1 Binding-protein-dependent transport system inner membrane component [Raineya orbicola]
MQAVKEEVHHSPGYYVKKRFFSNITAVAGLVVVIIAVIVAILGYLIMPDSTPNADDGSVYVKLKPPGYEVTFLKKHKNIPQHKPSFFEKMLFGLPSEYTIVPIKSYQVNRETLEVTYIMEGVTNKDDSPKKEKYSLVAAVKSLYVGELNGLKNLSNAEKFNGKPYYTEGEKVFYIDYEGKINQTTKAEIISEFEQKNIEKRTFLLGTDKQGRDLLSRLILGTRISLGIGLVAVFISVILGVTLGSLAGFFGGKIDYAINFLMTIVWSIPQIMLVIVISLALGRGVLGAFIALGLTTWVEIARLVRGEIMAIKEKQYIEAARALGLSNFRIVFRHILPNLFGPLIVMISSNFAAAILTEAGLSFLGMGAQPPTPSWGMMVSEGKDFIGSDTGLGVHLIFYPSMAICLLVLAFNLLGNGLRDAYDPKTLVK